MLPPRLLAVAPDGWHLDPDFARGVERLADAASLLPDRVAIYLRAHDWSLQTWQRELASRQWPAALALGVSLPPDAELPESSERLLASGVRFVHLTERDADRPLETWGSLAKSRVCHDPADARRRYLLGTDWLVVSPVHPTPSKPDVTPLGLDGLQAAARGAPGRVLALGGVTADNAAACLEHGAVGVAVLRAAWQDPWPLARALARA